MVDGRIGHTGGAGVSRKWMGNGRTEDHWRDTDVRVEGPVVEYLQAVFAENWLEVTGMVLGGEAYFPRPIEPRGQIYTQVARSSPASGSAAMYTTLLLALSSARTSVRVTNPYFVLDDTMREAMLRTVRRGVRVAVLVPAVIDHNLVREASRAQFGDLLRTGVEIYEYTPALLHAKTMVIDGVWATVGSTNLDNLSFAFNDELNLIVYDRAFARQLERVFDADVTLSRRVTYEAWKDRGVKARLFEVLAFPIRNVLGGDVRAPLGRRGALAKSDAAAARQHEPVEAEDDDRADDGHDESGRLTLAIQAHHAPQPAAEHGPDDAEHDREDNPARVRSRHDEPRHQTDDQAEHDPQEDVHRDTPFKAHVNARASHDGLRVHGRCHAVAL